VRRENGGQEGEPEKVTGKEGIGGTDLEEKKRVAHYLGRGDLVKKISEKPKKREEEKIDRAKKTTKTWGEKMGPRKQNGPRKQ